MPDPSNYASEDAWMEACVPAVMDEGRTHEQAVGQCEGMWEGRRGGIAEAQAEGMLAFRRGDAIIARPMIDRAWSVLTVKSINAERREIEGIASTPTVDRMGDVVEPMGAKFTLPMPLLWQHQHDQPVGHVLSAKATKDGIAIKAKLALIEEAGELKNMVDKAWQAVKAGLVRGLSIGFKPHEYEALDKGGGLRFTSYSLYELSLVTIPANADASITLVKSLDTGQLAASGNGQGGSATDGAQAASSARPGASGNPGKWLQPIQEPLTGSWQHPNRKERAMSKTAAEMVSELEAKRSANTARMEAIMAKAMDEGRATEGDEQEAFDELDTENERIDGDLERYRKLEKSMRSNAKPVEQVKSAPEASAARGGNGTYVRVSAPRSEPGIRFARVVKALGMAQGNRMEAAQIGEQLYSDDPGVVNVLKAAARYGSMSSEMVTKAAVEAGTTGTWGSFLVGDEGSVFADFAEFLRPMTILGRFGTGGVPSLRRVPFRTPLLLQTGGGEGYWTGEGKGKGVTSFTGTRTTLTPLKAANIVVLTDELVRDSSPSAEAMVRDQMAAALAARIDTDFIDPGNAGTADIKPASITNGVTPTASSGSSADAVRTDMQALFAPFIAADNPPAQAVLIMSASTALSLSHMTNEFGTQHFPGITMNGGSFQGIPVIVSEYVGDSGSPTGRFVWLVNASDIFLGDDGGISVDISREASLQMDSAPTNAAIETGSPSQAVPTTLVSLWQTNTVGFRAERTVNWKLRRTSAVSGLSSVQWGA